MNMFFSGPTAITLTLLSAVMWGSWMQVIKLKGDYPVEGLVFWMFIFSFILIWGIMLFWYPEAFLEESIAISKGYVTVISEILMGGAMLSCGVLFGLVVMQDLGMLLVTTLSGTVTSILGIVTSIAKEGMPKTPGALFLILTAAAGFFLASFICAYASSMCNRDRKLEEKEREETNRQKKISIPKVLLYIALYAVLSNGWSIGTAAGVTSGMPVILICAYMSAGSVLGISVVCSIFFTYKRMWKTVLCINKKKQPLLLSMAAAFGYYGGNMISIYCMPSLGVTLSFLFGRTYSLWTYFWSFLWKEYQGAGRKTMIVLGLGIAFYICALSLLFIYSYEGA